MTALRDVSGRPVVGTSPDGDRCAVRTRGEDPDPVGTAPRFAELVLVEVPLPWPADITGLPALAAASEASSLRRVMAVVPPDDRDPGQRMVTWYRRGGGRGRFRGWELVVPVDGVADLLASLVRGEEPPAHQLRPSCSSARTALGTGAAGAWARGSASSSSEAGSTGGSDGAATSAATGSPPRG